MIQIGNILRNFSSKKNRTHPISFLELGCDATSGAARKDDRVLYGERLVRQADNADDQQNFGEMGHIGEYWEYWVNFEANLVRKTRRSKRGERHSNDTPDES